MFEHHKKPAFNSILSVIAVFLLSACETGGIQTEAKFPTGKARDGASGNEIYEERESVFGDGGIFGSRKNEGEGDGSSGISVNSFLWRASLDTVSFMPLASADPFGGVILTDWYTPPEVEGERFKVNVFILTRELRSDGVRVRTFKQYFQNGKWVDADVTAETGRQLEDTILTRARQLRAAQLDN